MTFTIKAFRQVRAVRGVRHAFTQFRNPRRLVRRTFTNSHSHWWYPNLNHRQLIRLLLSTYYNFDITLIQWLINFSETFVKKFFGWEWDLWNTQSQSLVVLEPKPPLVNLRTPVYPLQFWYNIHSMITKLRWNFCAEVFCLRMRSLKFNSSLSSIDFWKLLHLR